jgi:hypothetical protein
MGTPRHLYLPGPHRGVFNRDGIEGAEEVILTEALIDALTFWRAGYRHVTSSYGINGFTDELLAALTTCGAKRVLIAYDRDGAGDAAAERLAPPLQAAGLDVFRLLFPKGQDANSYALAVKPAEKALGLVIRAAQWLGNGARPALTSRCFNSVHQWVDGDEASPVTRAPATASPPSEPTTPASSLPVPALVDPVLAAEPSAAPPASSAGAPRDAASTDGPPTEAPLLPARAVGATPEPEIEAQQTERDVTMVFGERRYRVRGLAKNGSFDVLRVNVLVSAPAGMHVDTLDLYVAKARAQYAKQAAAELQVEESVIGRDLGRLLLELEALQERQITAAMAPKAVPAVAIEPAAHEAALALLRDPQLIERIVADFDRSGLVGEEANTLVAYLACVSRKLAAPLAIIIQSTSAAGKSTLMDAALALVPEEDRVHYSAMTGQSLFYLGEQSVKHKILAIAEEEGVRQAAYALKVLQSQGELTIASTGKDPATGMLVTQEYRVEGPVMLFLTTTAIDLDEELLNRCLVLTIDESREQTRLIQRRQRTRRTLPGLLAKAEADDVLALHRNAQRLLRPLAVVNPYAEQLTFLDDRTRTRRDHAKYLTLIESIALLHQHQRPVRTVNRGGKAIEYVEVELADVALANRLAHEVLGRSLDELPPQTRRLLRLIDGFVAERAATQALERQEVRFTRRELRQVAGMSEAALRVHVERLVDLEYLLPHAGRNGQRFVYELLFDGRPESDAPQMIGLIDVAALHALQERSTTATSQGSEPTSQGRFPNLAPTSRAARGPLAGTSSVVVHGTEPSSDAVSSESAPLNGQKALLPEVSDARGRSRRSSLAAASEATPLDAARA